MGELQGASVTLAEIIAYVKQTHQTGRLLVRTRPSSETTAPAELTFESGHLIDAHQGGERGDDLVYRLLANREASYAFDRLSPEALPSERSISRVQELLVLAAIGILSEEDAGMPDPGRARALEAATQPAIPAPPPPDQRAPRPFKRRNMIPLPSGEPISTLDAPPRNFVAFLDQLESVGLSGYVTWFSEGGEGLLLLYQGQVIDAFWAEVHSPATYSEHLAVRQFAAAHGADGARHVEVYKLDPDFVWSYSALAYGANRPQEQGLEQVVLPALLARLASSAHTGCVKIVAGRQAAYLFLCRGLILGEYRAAPHTLEPAPGRAMTLVGQPGSLVDIYTSPAPAALLALNAAAWPIARVVSELQRTTREVLGPKAGPVLTLFASAAPEPPAIQAACARAKQVTRVFIGAEAHAELSRRLDRLLAHLQT